MGIRYLLAAFGLIVLAATAVVAKGIPQTAEIAAFAGGLKNAWPLGAHFIANSGSALSSLLLAAALFLIYDALGLLLLEWAGGKRPSGPARFAAVFAGYAVVSTLILGLSTAGLLYASILWVLLLVPAVAAPCVLMQTAHDWKEGFVETWKSSGVFLRICWLPTAMVWLFLLLLPEINNDCMDYHLTFPLQLLGSHRFFNLDVYSSWTFPLLSDLPNVLALQPALDAAAKTLRPMLILTGLLAIFRGIFPSLNSSGILTAAIAAILLPGAREFVFHAKNDAVIAAALAALSGLLIHRNAATRGFRSPATALLCGGLAGFLLASKFTAAPLLLPAALLILVRTGARRGRLSLLSIAAGTAVISPWLAKSFLYFGDPLYPAGTLYLAPLFANPHFAESIRQAHANYVGANAFKNTAIALYEAMFPGALPLLIPLAYVAFAPKLRGTLLYLACLVTGLALMTTVVKWEIDRFAYPVYLVLAGVSIAILLGESRQRGERVFERMAAGIVLAAAAFLGVFISLKTLFFTFERHPGSSPAAFFSGQLSVEEYRLGNFGAYGRILPTLLSAGGDRGRALIAIGNTNVWQIPARVIGRDIYRPFFMWKAVHDSDSPLSCPRKVSPAKRSMDSLRRDPGRVGQILPVRLSLGPKNAAALRGIPPKVRESRRHVFRASAPMFHDRPSRSARTSHDSQTAGPLRPAG